jgi:DNA-binding HxlR family transcriptional regulator
MVDHGNAMSGDAFGGTLEGAAGCPLDPVLNVLAQKWFVHVVWFLGHSESLRFNELQRQLPGDVSAKVLSARLKQLEMLNIIARDDKGTNPPHVEYRLTASGRSINDLLANLEMKARGLSLPVVPAAALAEEVIGSSAAADERRMTQERAD